MFSLFEGGINDTKCSKIIDLPELIRLIRSNPNAEIIESIRNLRHNDDDYYKVLKTKLPNITPVCLVKVRNLDTEHYQENFIHFSQYLYYDIDKSNAEEYKNYFISRYGHQASLVCLSVSGGGISVLFKVKNIITKENFDDVWLTVRNQILGDEPIDEKCKNISRAMFISYDPSVYYNFENEIEIELKETPKKGKKEGNQSKTYKKFNFTLNSPFSIIKIGTVLEKLKTKTKVDVANPVVDFKPLEYTQIFIPKNIKDGTKHSTYKSMIHTLYYLNPEIEKVYLFSFMWYVNNRFAKPRMEKREFVKLFNWVYDDIKSSGKTDCHKEIKYIHFNEDCNLTKAEKTKISNWLNGFKRKNESIQKIIDAKIELQQLGKKTNQKNIVEISGLSPKTVRAHYNSSLTDMDELVKEINDSVP